MMAPRFIDPLVGVLVHPLDLLRYDDGGAAVHAGRIALRTSGTRWREPHDLSEHER